MAGIIKMIIGEISNKLKGKEYLKEVQSKLSPEEIVKENDENPKKED